MIFTSGDFKFRLTEALSNLPVERTFTLTSFLNSSGLPKRLISLNAILSIFNESFGPTIIEFFVLSIFTT